MRSMTIFCMGARRKSEHSSYVFLRELEICVILEHIYIICVMLECMYIYISAAQAKIMLGVNHVGPFSFLDP